MIPDSRYWIAASSLSVLALCAVTWSSGRDRMMFRVPIAIIAPFAFVSLTFSSSASLARIFPRAGGGGANDSTIALALFSIVATLCTGYAFVVVGRFDKQRVLLDQRVEIAEKTASAISETSAGLQRSLAIAETALELGAKRLRAYFQIHRAMSETDPEESIDSFRTYLDLRLLESLVCRTEWDPFRFDLEELLVVSNSDPIRLSRICHGPLIEYMSCIPIAGSATFPHLEGSDLTPVFDLIQKFLASIPT